MLEIRIKKTEGQYSYEQYHTEVQVCKRVEELREKGVDVDDMTVVRVTNYDKYEPSWDGREKVNLTMRMW